MKKSKISKEFKKWLEAVSKKYARALNTLAKEDSSENAFLLQKHCKKKK